ncbi:putative tRNA-dihydrouridine synthase [Limihaloglobus sulfuriphilus]|uniref:tRNA-dihydrouridine synthase n=1 Tax=Limihaloglobus sulfuriphilus TaxID=1851148 RepID=A0A1Q2ME17_9BACT|nr:tRNA-dihydrouridine synthase [Limihaloglobus sulfuriphilus]AQQ70910.1 putative tRNA-dihydrouridine synthase [Limihaloglobus sulfuriphilus]
MNNITGKKLYIGSIKLEMPVLMAPLSGYTDSATRSILRNFGAPLTFPGVMLSKSAANPKILRKPEYQPQPCEKPVGAQILGAEPKIMAEAAAGLEKSGFDLIDINFACPAPKVLRRGRGGYMLRDPQSVREVFLAVRNAIKVPLTVKLRIGYGEGEESRRAFWEIMDFFAQNPPELTVIHGRTTLQKYGGKADWHLIAEAKKRYPHLKIAGSGDIFSVEDIISRLEQTGIDGILVARGAIGNPWIFRDAAAVFRGEAKPQPPSVQEQGRVMIEHVSLLRKVFDPCKSVRYFRKFSARYCKLHPHRKRPQTALMAAKNMDDFLSAIKTHYGVEPNTDSDL